MCIKKPGYFCFFFAVAAEGVQVFLRVVARSCAGLALGTHQHRHHRHHRHRRSIFDVMALGNGSHSFQVMEGSPTQAVLPRSDGCCLASKQHYKRHKVKEPFTLEQGQLLPEMLQLSH